MGGGASAQQEEMVVCYCRLKGEAWGAEEPPGLWFFMPTFPLLAVAHPIRPKPPSATSIPAILKALQDEWVSRWKRIVVFHIEDITGLGLGGGKDGALFSLLRGRMIVEEEPGW